MAYDITHKNSTVAGTPPTAAEVELGEIAINAADAELYTKDTNGSIQAFISRFTQNGTGAVPRTVKSKLQDAVSVKDFGAAGDGVTDDTGALVAAAAALQNGQQLDFGSGTYLISYQGTPYSSVYGNVVMDFLNKSDIALVGTGATIKVANHNITTNGGLRFANFKGCKRVRIAGLNFDMTFTGVNTSASYYPFCGAITAIDDSAAGQAQSALNGDFLIEDCTFKLYHPYGSFAQSGNPYPGDPNNGYKLFSIFTSGPYLATTFDSQCRNITLRNLTWRKGHNGYAIWTWAWNNVSVTGCIAEDFVTKYSNASGTLVGSGIPFIRYHQWHCSGLSVTDNYFRAKPCYERTAAGFEGAARFLNADTNLTGNYQHGDTVVSNNVIILGNGDAASVQSDYGVVVTCYGDVVISDNLFDGVDNSTNAYDGTCIYYAPFATDGDGYGSLSVTANTFGRTAYWLQNIICENGSNVSLAKRRGKELIVANNISRSQAQYFLSTGGGSFTYSGFEKVTVTGNLIEGENNQVWPSNTTNSRAINYVSSSADDIAVIANNIIRNKYFGIMNAAGAPPNAPQIYGNQYQNVTVETPYSAYRNLTFNSGHIKFPASPVSVAVVDPNTIDTYEEGTFTPTYAPASGAFTSVLTTASGRYIRIGKTVWFWIDIRTTGTPDLGTASGNLYITGLPFAASSAGGNAYVSLAQAFNLGTSVNGMQAMVDPSQSRLTLTKNASNASAAYVQATELSTATSNFGNLLSIAGQYQLTN